MLFCVTNWKEISLLLIGEYLDIRYKSIDGHLRTWWYKCKHDLFGK